MNDEAVRNLIMECYDAECRGLEEEIRQCPEPIFSYKHRRKMEDVFRQYDRKVRVRRIDVKGQQYRSAWRTGKRVSRLAVLIAILCLLMATTVIFAIVRPSFIVNIQKHLAEWTLTFDPDESKGGDTDTTLDFSYVQPETPEGYRIDTEEKNEVSYTILYRDEDNGNRQIMYGQDKVSEGTSASIGAENDYNKEIEMNGEKTILAKSGDEYSIFWFKADYMFTLSGNCDLDDLEALQKEILQKGL